ncbi:MAG: MurR/RpiR family transcriptional regulator [Anaerolineae bacterium]
MFQERIRENYDGLTPGFRKLADFLMTHTLDAAFLTATQLSRRVEVDPATVVRFAQELGYSGYRELSREIKRYVRDQVTATYRSAEEAEGIEDLLLALVENTQQNLQHFVTTDLGNVAKVIEIFQEAEHIWIVAEFMGFDLANFMAKNLEDLGLSSSAFYPSMTETASVLPKMKEGDVVLALVNDGPSIDAGYAVRMAREKGLKTVCITGTGVVLPAREAETAVIVPIKSPAGVPSFGTEILILGLIWEALASEMGEATGERYQKRQENMKRLLDIRAETPEYEVASPEQIWRQELPK